ncbi:hypothetical protein SALBM135S_02309 [Streptomyces alboniger]
MCPAVIRLIPAFAHSAAMSWQGPRSSTRSCRPKPSTRRRRCRSRWPPPKIRRVHSGCASATSAKARTAWSTRFSPVSRAAITMTLLSPSARGLKPSGTAFGMTVSSGAVGPRNCAIQSRVRAVSVTRASRRGACRSSGSPEGPRRWVGRCSWCTVTTRAGASVTAAASSAGVVVTRTSVSSPANASAISMSESRSKAPSQAGLISSLGSAASVRHAASSSSESRTGRSGVAVRSTR